MYLYWSYWVILYGLYYISLVSKDCHGTGLSSKVYRLYCIEDMLELNIYFFPTFSQLIVCEPELWEVMLWVLGEYDCRAVANRNLQCDLFYRHYAQLQKQKLYFSGKWSIIHLPSFLPLALQQILDHRLWAILQGLQTVGNWQICKLCLVQ